MMTMPFEDLERAYDELAAAIDRVGPSGEALLLAKLALLLAQRLDGIATFRESLAVALEDLPVAG
ncbi:MAG: hypothetical protein KGJ41_10795 [Rhodospirillales bacterium]|nr:hypothetical protein [Rhodospirillales bacterium]